MLAESGYAEQPEPGGPAMSYVLIAIACGVPLLFTYRFVDTMAPKEFLFGMGMIMALALAGSMQLVAAWSGAWITLPRLHPAWTAASAYLVIELASAAWIEWGQGPGTAAAWRRASGTAGFVAFGILAGGAFTARGRRRALVVALVVTAAAACLYAVAQQWHFDLSTDPKLPYHGVRYYGPLGNPNFLAAFLVFVMPLGLALLVESWPGSVVRRAVLLAWWGLTGYSLLHTFSRAGWFGFAVSLTVFAAALAGASRRSHGPSAWRRWALVAGWCVAPLLLAVAFEPRPLLDRIVHTFAAGPRATSTSVRPHWNSPSLALRLRTWEGALRMIRDRPLLGFGAGGFGVHYQRYKSAVLYCVNPDRNKVFVHAENEWLEIAAETGLIGIGAFLWFVLACVRSGWARVVSGDPRGDRWLVAGILAAFTGLLAHNIGCVNLRYPTSRLMLFAGAALLASHVPGRRAVSRLTIPGATIVRRVQVLAAVVAAATACGWGAARLVDD
ncbi:MAG: O-antigen ligase family protein, partial [bacterium]